MILPPCSRLLGKRCQALQRFARIEFDAEGVPDATTLLKFRRLLETHDLCKALFTAINADLAARDLRLREGTLVDATLIAAPSSTKNEKRAREQPVPCSNSAAAGTNPDRRLQPAACKPEAERKTRLGYNCYFTGLISYRVCLAVLTNPASMKRRASL